MFVLTDHNSIANQYMEGLRDISQQNDRLKFRRNMERLGEIIAYELSKSLDYSSHAITTPLAETTSNKLSDSPVIISILRAAIPFYQGFLNYFDQADSGFIGAYRKAETSGTEVEIDFSYLAAPNIEGKEIILVDPMLATGKSLITSVGQLLKNGTPKKIHIAAVIAAPEGIHHLKERLGLPYQLWLGAVDEKLNEKAYIVPGLGDAGDLSFGPKH
ncbi:uracil phosphoribosyltransferase [Echinicola strongylocentroti]|uniref:Uracil phosphoribosyltransferase n=1 Tax=Echinicola strongylocentroti TaxID=1795355 RepID=A0A2Z4IHY7_9BACT|nr:uracil phosphoribosyltransferase [Echinicola strongylocentroti]AWW30310.1 uracil phosphoribosyltransferase [Echinicola strongylocentroti]